MMEQLIFTGGTAQQQAEAATLHAEIRQKKETLGNALVDFCDALKRMRDTRLYEVLGYQDFGAYCEEQHGIKQRMAYKYIKAYEDCGRRLMEQNAAAGVTKLALLGEISATEREDFAAEHDLEGMSVAEVRAAIEEARGLREQLSFLETDAALKEKSAAHQLAVKEEELKMMRRALEEARTQPIPADAVEVDVDREERLKKEAAAQARAEVQAEIDRLKAEVKEKVKTAREAAEKKAASAMEKAKKEAAAAAEKTAQERLDRELAQANSARAEAEARARELAKKLELAAGRESIEFALHFEQLQAAYTKMADAADALAEKGDVEQADKLRGALGRALNAMLEQLGDS